MQEFKDDMAAANVPACEMCSPDWFAKVFRKNSHLAHITIASGKQNFGRCRTCVMLEQKITSARKAHDAVACSYWKKQRFSHLLLERADKISYYNVRC